MKNQTVMTYQKLLQILNTFDHEQLKMDVNIYNSLDDEYYSAKKVGIVSVPDVLDENHPYLVF